MKILYKFLLVLALSAPIIMAVSCSKDDPTEEEAPETGSDDDSKEDPDDTQDEPDVPQNPGTTDDEPQSGEIVSGLGDETLYTGVSAWTGRKADDTASAANHSTTDADLYWEANKWEDAVTIVYDGSKATITKSNSKILTYATGAHVTVDMQTNSVNHTVVLVKGKSTDGSLKIYGDKKFKLTMCGLDLTSTIGPAVNIQCHKRAFVHMVEGSTNRITDASTYSNDKYYLGSATSSTEDRKAAFFSEGNLLFSGAGCLVVNGKYKHGICTDGFLFVRPGATLAVESAASNAIHAKGDQDDNIGFEMRGGCISATVAASEGKGIKCDTTVVISGGTVAMNVTGAAGKGIKGDNDVTISGGTFEITTSGAAVYDSSAKDVSSACCIKSDGNLTITGGTFTLKSTGQAGKCLKAGSDDNAGRNIVIGTSKGGPVITASTSGSAYGSSSSGGGGRPGGGWPGGGGGGGSTSSASSKAKCIKASGSFTMNGGELNISTSTSEAEGIESKLKSTNSIVFNGGKTYIKAYDDGVNSAGQIVVNDGYLYVWATNNDAIDSNYGQSNSLVIAGGYVFAFSASSPEEAFDCDSHSRITIKGGTIFTSGGEQGGGGSTMPSTTVPLLSLSSFSVSTGYFTVTDSSGKVLFSVYAPRSQSGSKCFVRSADFKSGTSYKYGMAGSSAPSGATALWGKYLYSGGTASVSNTYTASTGATSK